ncbi:MAG: hypothetical protein CME62_01375 [Halobacteriovoraceae bacterium]|nr:hypothetical protein [Halobacteriovoraceae bacterium]|tara:strand:+ start:24501 stop:24809 length:309 start_codon:yes stop_codon:yes gene_type:complete
MKNLVLDLIKFLLRLVPKSISGNTLTCKEVAYILSTVDDVSGPEYKTLRFHRFVCNCCGNYQKQLDTIGRAAVNLNSVELDFSEEQLARIKAQQDKISKFYK